MLNTPTQRQRPLSNKAQVGLLVFAFLFFPQTKDNARPNVQKVSKLQSRNSSRAKGDVLNGRTVNLAVSYNEIVKANWNQVIKSSQTESLALLYQILKAVF